MHDNFHNDAVQSGKSIEIWFEYRSTSPLFAAKTFLSKNLEVIPKFVNWIVLFFKVKTEEYHSIISSPLSHVIFLFIPFKLGASIVLTLESQLNSPLYLILIAIVIVLKERLLIAVKNKLIALLEQTL